MPYLFDHAVKTERERLAAIEAAADPLTIECLEKLDVAAGWHCLEVGAGAGSMASWLCGRVGPDGKVVATDLQTKFLETIEAPNLEVRRHDITADELEQGAFDLVSARKVLEHLADPSAALRRMAGALRPRQITSRRRDQENRGNECVPFHVVLPSRLTRTADRAPSPDRSRRAIKPRSAAAGQVDSLFTRAMRRSGSSEITASLRLPRMLSV